MSIEWKQTTDGVDWVELEAMYRAAPLGSKNAAQLAMAFGNSRFVLFAYDAGRLVGAGRALADGVDCAYLCDVALLPTHQGRGVGQALVERLLTQVRGHRKVILYSVPGKESFYARFGFRRMKTAMGLFEHPEPLVAEGIVE